MNASDYLDKLECEIEEYKELSIQYLRNVAGGYDFVTIEFNPILWEPKELPDDVIRGWFRGDSNILDQDGNIKVHLDYLHYIGPLDIDFELPKQSIYYHTFENRTDMTKLPSRFPAFEYWEPFYGCTNLKISREEAKKVTSAHWSGTRHGNLLECCGSNAILDSHTTQKDYLKELIGIDADFYDEYTNWSGRSLLMWSRVCVSYEDLSNILVDLGECIKDIPNHDWVNASCGYIQFKHISQASDMEDLTTLVAKPEFIIKANRTGAISVEGEATIIVYIFDDDFVNDTMDPNILRVRPQQIHGAMTEYVKISDNGTLELDGDLSIEVVGAPAIVVESVATIKGNGHTLLCVTKDNMQPALGLQTHTGMSYGRWCPDGYHRFKKLILDNVHVKLVTPLEAFTIGSYGTEEMPEIELRNGATLECPEMTGERIMVQSGAEGLYGSTKRESPAVYEIIHPEN